MQGSIYLHCQRLTIEVHSKPFRCSFSSKNCISIIWLSYSLVWKRELFRFFLLACVKGNSEVKGVFGVQALMTVGMLSITTENKNGLVPMFVKTHITFMNIMTGLTHEWKMYIYAGSFKEKNNYFFILIYWMYSSNQFRDLALQENQLELSVLLTANFDLALFIIFWQKCHLVLAIFYSSELF